MPQIRTLGRLADMQNQYLDEHPRADQHKAWRTVLEKSEHLALGTMVTVKAANRQIKIDVDTEHITSMVEPDGCYALNSDLPAEAADKDVIHSRYKY